MRNLDHCSILFDGHMATGEYKSPVAITSLIHHESTSNESASDESDVMDLPITISRDVVSSHIISRDVVSNHPRKRQKKETMINYINGMIEKMRLLREARAGDTRLRERAVENKEREVKLHAIELELQRDATRRAVKSLVKNYGHVLDIGRIIKALEILENDKKAMIFLSLRGTLRDAWLKAAIDSII